MRVGIITSSYPAGPSDSSNSGVFVRDFAWKLADAGLGVVVVTPQRAVPSPGQPFSLVSFPWPGTETSLSHVDPRSPLNLARLGVLLASGAWSSIRVFRREGVDHIVAMFAVPSGILALAARGALGTPYSVWALGPDIWQIRNYPMGEVILRRVLRSAAHLYADGLGLAEEVERIARRSCQFLASLREMPEASEIEPARLPPHLTHVLCVSRFHPDKGVDVLIDAVKLIPERIRRSMKFHIFGGGPDEDLLARKLADDELRGCVTLGGYISRDDLMSYLRAARCLVIPSRVESIPLVLSDAAQARCPVVATQVGDMGGLVQDYGLGLGVPPESPQALADAIVRFHEGSAPFDPEGARRLVADLSLDQSVRHFLNDVQGKAPSR